MTTKDLILPGYIYIDDKGREVTISKSLKSMDVVIRNEDRTVDHVIFAALVDHPDRITWKREKFCELTPMDFAISNKTRNIASIVRILRLSGLSI